MSEPIRKYEDKLHGVISELIDAHSSLNMEPSPIQGKPRDSRGYLSEVDHWASHAYDHISAAIDLARQAQDEALALRRKIVELRLRIEVLEKRKESADVLR